jgi:CheY-like chemotaxis protein
MARILVAEDRSAQREQIRRMLERAGHSVEFARNGVEAIDSYADQRPDVVIMDLFMPVMNGFDALAHLLRMFPGVRIIAVSDGSPPIGPQALTVALDLGAARAVEKPLAESPLLDVIEELLAV